MPSAYMETTVPIARSQEAIRKLLITFGARGVQFAENFETGEINVRFGKALGPETRTVSVSMMVPEPPKPRRARRSSKSQAERKEQMTRATYRALHDWLKAQFVAVEFGLLSFEDVFLSHFEWMIDGQRMTVGELIKPRLAGHDHLLPAPREGEWRDAS